MKVVKLKINSYLQMDSVWFCCVYFSVLSFLVLYGCYCSLSLSHSAVDWSVVCVCDIAWSYSLTFWRPYSIGYAAEISFSQIRLFIIWNSCLYGCCCCCCCYCFVLKGAFNNFPVKLQWSGIILNTVPGQTGLKSLPNFNMSVIMK